MNTNENAIKDRQRKALLVYPLLVIPFLTMAFCVLGKGKKADAQNQTVQSQKGINMSMPNASDQKIADKMASYKEAAQDSSKKSNDAKYDPFYKQGMNMNLGNNSLDSNQPLHFSPGGATPTFGGSAYTNPNEAKVYEKLNTLNSVLNQPQSAQNIPVNPYQSAAAGGVNSADIDRLEKMMKTMQQSGGQPDSDMIQINGMLEKVFQIQHPELVQDKIRETSEKNRGQVYPVTTNINKDPISLLGGSAGDTGIGPNIKSPSRSPQNGFFTLDDEITDEQVMNMIPAVVHETQTLVDGSTVKLRLTSDVMISGVLIPKDNFLFGAAHLNGERLSILITGIRYHNSIFPVQLMAVDLDGMDGVRIPDAISRNVAKESVNGAMSGLGLSSVDPSIGAQAASAGIEAARTLIGKKVKLIKVTVKAGYQVLLKSNKQQ